ncbi:hypothetical protein HPB47_014926 [Ixodes persulcatus]|uniref:Uncharacterized protein n=1 Tax=Ixodes persulcatus TaxID=34615 RepID=A0AC60R0K9_IXOPE|nr:hypothetical protein HPB47_014926 [Ixodes persulcatus]
MSENAEAAPEPARTFVLLFGYSWNQDPVVVEQQPLADGDVAPRAPKATEMDRNLRRSPRPHTQAETSQVQAGSVFFLVFAQLLKTRSRFELRPTEGAHVMSHHAGSEIYPVAVSSSLINPEAPSCVAVEGDLEAASPAEAVLVAFCL